MGHELIHLETRDDADEFLKDHKGSSIVLFDDVTLEQLTGLDAGVFK